MMKLIRVFALFFAALAWTQPALADNWADCRADDAEVAITGCTAVIDAGTSSQTDEAEAYVLRARARNAREEHDDALTDLNKAVELDPKNADALFERGVANKALGKYEAAIRDFDKASTLNATGTDEPAKAKKTTSSSKSDDARKSKKATPRKAKRNAKPKKRRAQQRQTKPKPKKKRQAKKKQPKENIREKVNKQISCSIGGGFDC